MICYLCLRIYHSHSVLHTFFLTFLIHAHRHISMAIKTDWLGFSLEYIVLSITVIEQTLFGKWTFLAFVDIIRRHFIPLLNVFDLDFSNCDRSVTILVYPVLHFLEPLHWFLAESVSHIIQQSELTDAIEDCVDHLDVQGWCHEKHERTHFRFTERLFIIFFLIIDFFL